MKNKLPFKEGDILFNNISNKFIYVYDSSFVKWNLSGELINCRVEYSFMVIGFPNDVISDCSTVGDLSLYLTRYGDVNSIGMTIDDLKALDIDGVDSKVRGVKFEKINRDIKLRFLQSY